MIEVVSFGYKYGKPRGYRRISALGITRNPYNIPKLAWRTGIDVEVQQYIERDRNFPRVLEKVKRAIDEGVERIAVGCIGGRHRSVTVVERIKREMPGVSIRHLDLYRGGL